MLFSAAQPDSLVELTEPAGQADTKTSASVSLDVAASANQISFTNKTDGNCSQRGPSMSQNNVSTKPLVSY